MNKVFALGLLSAGLLGCASEPLQLQSELTYQAEWTGGKPRLHPSRPTLTLADDGRAYGSGGCNHWFATYTWEADKLSFTQIGSTRKMCEPAVMEQEQRFLETLGKVQRWDFSAQDELRLWPEQGKPLRLQPEEG